MFRTAIGFCLILLAGCGTTAGVAEFKIYTQSINAVAEASTPIVDRLSVVERANAVDLIDRDGVKVNGATAGLPVRGLAQDFKVEHAAYFAETGRPPFAGSVDLSIAALQRFNAALAIYADGKALDAARSDLLAVATNAQLAAAALKIPLKGAVPVIEAASEGAAILGAIGSRAAFRRLLKSEGKKVDDLLVGLIKNAPIIFQYLSAPEFDERALEVPGTDGFTKATEKVRNTRTLVAEWVLLLQTARQALAASLAAVDQPGTAGTGIADAALISAEIKTRLERIRAILAKKS